MSTDNSADARRQSSSALLQFALFAACRIRNDFAFALRDASPVTPLRTLVLPRSHTPTSFDLTDHEIAAANDLLRRLRAEILAADLAAPGFNIGTNIGAVSGQTILHCHIHSSPPRSRP